MGEADDDADFLKYQEERNNTMKMSTILKSLNSPKKKRKAIETLRQRAQAEAQELADRQNRRSRSHRFIPANRLAMHDVFSKTA